MHRSLDDPGGLQGRVAAATLATPPRGSRPLGLYVLDSSLTKDVLIADVDEDGQTDLVTNHEAWTHFTIGQPLRQRFSEDESARLVGVGALDEDGRPGLVLVNEETSRRVLPEPHRQLAQYVVPRLRRVGSSPTVATQHSATIDFVKGVAHEPLDAVAIRAECAERNS